MVLQILIKLQLYLLQTLQDEHLGNMFRIGAVRNLEPYICLWIPVQLQTLMWYTKPQNDLFLKGPTKTGLGAGI